MFLVPLRTIVWQLPERNDVKLRKDTFQEPLSIRIKASNSHLENIIIHE